MTRTTNDADRTGAPWRLRSDLEVALQQVEAIERFHRSRHLQEQAARAVATSRESRMDAARRLDVLRREHDALVHRSQEQLQASGDLLRRTATPTVLLAHRHAWFLDRVSAVLVEHGLRVVGRVDNGADAVGEAVAEQPDVLLVEDALAMVPGEDVVRDVRRLCPSTRVLAQVDHADRVGVLLLAGAAAVHTRCSTPADVARALEDLASA